MTTSFNILLFIKYLLAIMIVIAIIFTPAWLARQTKKDKYDMVLVRLASWVLCWTGITWLWSLFWSSKK